MQYANKRVLSIVVAKNNYFLQNYKKKIIPPRKIHKKMDLIVWSSKS
jgi:hypothetical protein